MNNRPNAPNFHDLELIAQSLDGNDEHVFFVKSLHVTGDTYDWAEIINIDGDGVRIVNVPVMKFLNAWEDSGRFLV